MTKTRCLSCFGHPFKEVKPNFLSLLFLLEPLFGTIWGFKSMVYLMVGEDDEILLGRVMVEIFLIWPLWLKSLKNKLQKNGGKGNLCLLIEAISNFEFH